MTIPARFNGPDRSGNGGWVSGLLAEHYAEVTGHAGPVASTLRLPPPLDTPLAWELVPGDEPVLHLETHGGALVGEARAGSFTREPVPCPTAVEAARGLASYPGFHEHPFDHCFTCGTARAEGDGLRLFTGPVAAGTPRTAAPWTSPSLDVPTTWAALDCPGGWAVDFTQHVVVLGRMTAEVLREPAASERLLATGDLASRDGRKFLTSSALYTEDGELLGRAEQTWIEVDLATFA